MACSFCPYPLKDDKTSKLNLEDIYNLLDSIDLNDKEFKCLQDKKIFDILKY